MDRNAHEIEEIEAMDEENAEPNIKDNRIKEMDNCQESDVQQSDSARSQLKAATRNNLLMRLNLWVEARQKTVASLRDLASYLDRVGCLANIVVAVRGSAVQHGVAVGTGILTFAVGVSVPFMIAGAGIGLASLISRAVGVGGGLIGTCLGVVGGVLTVVTAGAALPVVVAGVGIWFASGIARWVGAGGGLVARGVTLLGGAVMVLAASTGVVVALGAAGLWLAVPAFTREVLGSGYVRAVDKVIGEEIRVAGEMVRDFDAAWEEENLNKSIDDIKNVLSGKVIVILEGSPFLWDLLKAQKEMKNLVQDWKEGSTHIRLIADQLEEGIEKLAEKNLEFL